MDNLVAYARKVEGDMYESANSRVKYLNYHTTFELSFNMVCVTVRRHQVAHVLIYFKIL